MNSSGGGYFVPIINKITKTNKKHKKLILFTIIPSPKGTNLKGEVAPNKNTIFNMKYFLETSFA